MDLVLGREITVSPLETEEVVRVFFRHFNGQLQAISGFLPFVVVRGAGLPDNLVVQFDICIGEDGNCPFFFVDSRSDPGNNRRLGFFLFSFFSIFCVLVSGLVCSFFIRSLDIFRFSGFGLFRFVGFLFSRFGCFFSSFSRSFRGFCFSFVVLRVFSFSFSVFFSFICSGSGAFRIFGDLFSGFVFRSSRIALILCLFFRFFLFLFFVCFFFNRFRFSAQTESPLAGNTDNAGITGLYLHFINPDSVFILSKVCSTFVNPDIYISGCLQDQDDTLRFVRPDVVVNFIRAGRTGHRGTDLQFSDVFILHFRGDFTDMLFNVFRVKVSGVVIQFHQIFFTEIDRLICKFIIVLIRIDIFSDN